MRPAKSGLHNQQPWRLLDHDPFRETSLDETALHLIRSLGPFWTMTLGYPRDKERY